MKQAAITLALVAMTLAGCAKGTQGMQATPLFPAVEEEHCGANCELPPVRAMLATPFGDRVALALASTEGELMLFTGDPATPGSFRNIGVISGAGRPLAITTRGDRIVIAYLPQEGVGLWWSSIDPATGAATALPSLSDQNPIAASLATDSADRLHCAFALDNGGVVAVRLGDSSVTRFPHALPDRITTDVAVERYLDGVMLVRSSRDGVDAQFLTDSRETAPLELARGVTEEVDAVVRGNGVGVAWTTSEEVRFGFLKRNGLADEPRRIDAGQRTSEPAHTVGARVDLSARHVAFQDQTRGTVVSAPTGEIHPLREHSHMEWTRGLSVQLVTIGDARYLFDLGMRARQQLESRVFITRL